MPKILLVGSLDSHVTSLIFFYIIICFEIYITNKKIQSKDLIIDLVLK